MNDNKYISEMIVGISNAQERGLISPSEGKHLADGIVANSITDMTSAKCIEAYWDMKDSDKG